ncbi:MAG: type II secretion system protein [Clostridiales bacterium]|nr:type II secretion system protein [Clostridiales bacterium]
MKKGFTLIEVIIAIALLGIVMLMLSTVFTYGLRNYRIGLEQQDEQFNIRLAADTIADEAKVASHVGVFDNTDDFVSVNSSDGIAYYVDADNRLVRVEGGNIRYLTDEVVSSVSFQMLNTGSIYYLQFTIIGNRGYSLNTKIELLNIKTGYSSSPDVDEFCLTSDNIGMTKETLNIFYEYE